jgi:hypothetical protein
MSAVVKISRRQPASPDCSSDVLQGHWATSTRCILGDAACVGSTDLNMELADGPRRLRFSSFEVAVVSSLPNGHGLVR